MTILILKLKADYKQYGTVGFIKRVFKFVFRKLGIQLNSYYYLINEIDYEKQKEKWESQRIDNVKELIFDDFKKGDSTIFTPQKINLLKRRFDSGGYLAYGLMSNNQLIYSCMLSLEEMCFSNQLILDNLEHDECLMIDAYCSKENRGCGIHGMMNIYRLMKGFEYGKKKCIVIVLKENLPSLKSQTKVGFKIMFTYFVLIIGKKRWTNYYHKKQQYKNSILKEI